MFACSLGLILETYLDKMHKGYSSKKKKKKREWVGVGGWSQEGGGDGSWYI